MKAYMIILISSLLFLCKNAGAACPHLDVEDPAHKNFIHLQFGKKNARKFQAHNGVQWKSGERVALTLVDLKRIWDCEHLGLGHRDVQAANNVRMLERLISRDHVQSNVGKEQIIHDKTPTIFTDAFIEVMDSAEGIEAFGADWRNNPELTLSSILFRLKDEHRETLMADFNNKVIRLSEAAAESVREIKSMDAAREHFGGMRYDAERNARYHELVQKKEALEELQVEKLFKEQSSAHVPLIEELRRVEDALEPHKAVQLEDVVRNQILELPSLKKMDDSIDTINAALDLMRKKTPPDSPDAFRPLITELTDIRTNITNMKSTVESTLPAVELIMELDPNSATFDADFADLKGEVDRTLQSLDEAGLANCFRE